MAPLAACATRAKRSLSSSAAISTDRSRKLKLCRGYEKGWPFGLVGSASLAPDLVAMPASDFLPRAGEGAHSCPAPTRRSEDYPVETACLLNHRHKAGCESGL